MNLFDLGAIVKPLTDMVDNLNTSDEEKGQIQATLENIRGQIAMKALETEAKLVEAQSNVLMAEANGNWLQRSWRPVMMWIFMMLIILDSFGILPNRLAPDAWTLLTIGLGGYTVGRSAEKVMTAYQRGA